MRSDQAGAIQDEAELLRSEIHYVYALTDYREVDRAIALARACSQMSESHVIKVAFLAEGWVPRRPQLGSRRACEACDL